MKSIAARFSLAVAALAIVFSAAILYDTWSSDSAETEELVSRQAEMAMEFDLAVRRYAADVIRPEVAKRLAKDDFPVELMSTSYIARQVFENVRKSFPDYVLKFPAENPRNPLNQAGPEELRVLEYFRQHPDEPEWSGELAMNGSRYLAHAHVMRMDPSCLECHGSPEQAPKALAKRYGDKAGFHRRLGDVAGMDLVAIPMDRVNAMHWTQAKRDVLTAAAWLAILVAAILLAFRWIVSRRLKSITSHFQEASLHAGELAVQPVAISGEDEIAVLGRSFNALAARLRALHESLEERVRLRTAELAKEQRTLKHLLQSGDHERQLIAYDIHDGLAQHLAAALMQFETAEHLRQSGPEEFPGVHQAAMRSLRQGLAEARRLISGVRPPILDESGVVAAITHLVHDSRQAGISPEITFTHQVQFDRLAPVLENAIYRIAQEGLANALRHSNSNKVAVELVQQGDRVRIGVQDWGAGFTPDKAGEGGFGLEGIRQRARLLGGTAIIEAAPGQGTRISAELPLVLREALA